MADFSQITGLSSVADRYGAILCDVWGVIHNGRRAFESACDALIAFRKQGGKVILITNAPVPKAQVIRYFEPLGVPAEAYDDCVSSGDATRNLLRDYEGRTVWFMGVDSSFDGDRALWAGLDLRPLNGPEADTILCMGLDDNVEDDPEAYRDRIKPGVEAGLTMICANPDIQVRVGDRLVWCAGALARIYEQEGGQVIYPGKPHAAIYDLARQTLSALAPEAASGPLLAIGDGPVTDIRGANLQGIDSLYVGSGLAAGDEMGDGGTDFADSTRIHLGGAGVHATYAMPALAW